MRTTAASNPCSSGWNELAAWLPRIAGPLAITGASGFVGWHLAAVLVRGGVCPRLLVRDPARIGDELFSYLDAPVRRVAARDSFVAYAPRLEEAILPQPETILQVLRDLLAF